VTRQYTLPTNAAREHAKRLPSGFVQVALSEATRPRTVVKPAVFLAGSLPIQH
jgi:hypothetical protein